MATFEKRGNFWRAKVRRRGCPDQTRSFNTKALAEKWARVVEFEFDHGGFVDRSVTERTTLSEILTRYAREVTPGKRGAQSEALRVMAMSKKHFANIQMSALTSSHLATFRDERLKQVSSGTVCREFNILAHAVETARREWGIHLPENPCRLVRRPPPSRPRDRRLREGEEQRLLAACDDARNRWLTSIVRLAIETGMRRSELLGLEWGNVNFDRRTAYLPLTKNGDSRAVPLSTRAVAILQSLPRTMNRFVFAGLTGNALKLAYQRAVIRAGVEGLRFHDLRHEATSRFFEKGLNVMEVASITGHKTLQMLRRYTHLSASDLVARLG